ncbi:MAG TPA: RNA methyltransferase [Streptosporangiaceae bacterium]|nr:RNA methyltransferase [Streptosporangiaceae bacterium]
MTGPARPAASPQTAGIGIRSPRVKAARQLGKRAFRERGRLFLAEGPQAVREALRQQGVLTELFVTGHGRGRHPELAAEAASQGIAVHEVSGEVMAELAQTITPQGMLGVCRFVDVPLSVLLTVSSPQLVAVLANVRDPGNAGTVLRTADAAGADGVIFAAASVDPYNSKCVRSSAGSMFHLPLVAGTQLAEAIGGLREAGLQVLAADGSASRFLDAPGGPDLTRPTAWLFGNEAWGLPDELLALADDVVAVPIYGQAESLNLAAAAAVCMYASARQLRGPR